jgi:hypothetical protein
MQSAWLSVVAYACRAVANGKDMSSDLNKV